MTGDARPTVVAGVDGSPLAPTVVQRAADQAEIRGADLHVVHVTHFPVVYSEVPIDWTKVAESERASVWASLEESIAGLQVPVIRVDLDGYPPDTLVDYAQDHDASLIVVGTRGRGDLASLVLGSTSHRTIHLARCDVLVVKPGAEDDLDDHEQGG